MKTALTAGQAEARVLAALAPLDTLAPDIAAEIEDAGHALVILATTVRERPDVADVIVDVMERRGRHDWAAMIRQLVVTSIPEIEQRG